MAARSLEELLRSCTVKLTHPGNWGTGFFVAPGWILTCAHVVKHAEKIAEKITVRWQGKENFAEAVVDTLLLGDREDIALLRCEVTAADSPPCVLLDATVQQWDRLSTFGYPDRDFPNGNPITFTCEGLTGDEPPLIKFKLGQVRPGMSGSPLLNCETGKVCGMVKFTRDRSLDLGGGAVRVSDILQALPKIVDLHDDFHRRNPVWMQLLQGNQASDVKIPAQLTPGQMQALQSALLNTLPDEDEFTMMVQFHLGIALNRISRARTYDRIIFDVIQWANAHNKLSQLVNGALETNPDSLELLQFIRSFS